VVSLAPEGKAKIHVLFICQVFYKIFLQIIFARAQKSPAGWQGWVVIAAAVVGCSAVRRVQCRFPLGKGRAGRRTWILLDSGMCRQ
jgi:hypothetical protein